MGLQAPAFVIDYPNFVFNGARMYYVDTKDPAAGLSLTQRQLMADDDFGLHAGFCPSCTRKFEIDSSWAFDCKAAGPHGHLVMQCDDGSAVITLPIASQAFFNRILDDLLGFTDAERTGIRTVLASEVSKLSPDLQPNESAILADTKKYRQALRFAWASL